MNKFNVGDRPWLASVGTKSVTKSCPVCTGNKFVTLILGTGETCILPCDYCRRGYEAPAGVVSEYEFTSGVEQLTIIEIHRNVTTDSDTTEYVFSDHRLAEEEKVFITREKALAECERVCANRAKEQRTRAEHIKANQAKSYSWNAGYHLREAKREETSAARHRELAAICKAKAEVDR